MPLVVQKKMKGTLSESKHKSELDKNKKKKKKKLVAHCC
jgi:hypothetical protein